MTEHDEDPVDRQEQVVSAVLKFLGIIVVVGLVIWVGTKVMVSQLDLDEVTTGPVGGISDFGSRPDLPTTALPDPTPTASPTPTPEPTFTPEPTPTEDPNSSEGQDGLTLSASPVSVDAGQRIDLSGGWPGRDNISLLVQRFESGEWVDFGVQTQVRVGSFATYVLTSRLGENRFRVYYPTSETASNAVVVTVN